MPIFDSCRRHFGRKAAGRREQEIRKEVLGQLRAYEAVNERLEVQEVRVSRRYVVCRHPVEAARPERRLPVQPWPL